MRRPLLLLVVLLALLAVGAGALALSSKPGLDDTTDAVDQRWGALRGPLTTRYERVATLVDALTQVGGPDRSVTQDLRESVARWQSVVATSRQARPEDEATSANELESLVARARADVAGSARLHGNAALDQALTDVALTAPPAPDIAAYNDAVRAYQRKRSRLPASLVAGVLGYAPRPLLELA